MYPFNQQEQSSMIQFRTGPHMGIPYDQARALGLSSALKGPEFYEQYVYSVHTSTPSERIMRAVMPDYKANRPRPTVTLAGISPESPLPPNWGDRDYIVGLLKACAESFKAPKEWRLPVPFDVLKPARKEKPE